MIKSEKEVVSVGKLDDKNIFQVRKIVFKEGNVDAQDPINSIKNLITDDGGWETYGGRYIFEDYG